LFASSLLSLSFPYLEGSIIDAALHHTKGGDSMAGCARPWRTTTARPTANKAAAAATAAILIEGMGFPIIQFHLLLMFLAPEIHSAP
jgi:hypothetical protein